MGKNPTAKRPTRILKMPITNYELRITNLKSIFRSVAFLCALSLFAGNSSAQIVDSAQQENDFAAHLDFLSRAIAGGSDEQKRDALLELRNYKTETASRIAVPALKDASEIVRATATASVVFLPKEEAARNLVPLLDDKKPLVRRESAYALGKVGNENTINALLKVLQKDKVTEVRNAAVVALGQIGNVAAVAELAKILQRKPETKEEFMRRAAARSIGQIAQILQTGKIKVLTPEIFPPAQIESIEQPAYPKLAETFPALRSAINILIQSLRNPKEFQDVRREAAFALGAIGDESAIEVLQANLNSEDYYLAEISRESLLKIAAATKN